MILAGSDCKTTMISITLMEKNTNNMNKKALRNEQIPLLESFQHKFIKRPCMRHFNMWLSQSELYKKIDICKSIKSLLVFSDGDIQIYTASYKSVLSTIFLVTSIFQFFLTWKFIGK